MAMSLDEFRRRVWPERHWGALLPEMRCFPGVPWGMFSVPSRVEVFRHDDLGKDDGSGVYRTRITLLGGEVLDTEAPGGSTAATREEIDRAAIAHHFGFEAGEIDIIDPSY